MNRTGALLALLAVAALVAVIAWVTLRGDDPVPPRDDPEPGVEDPRPVDPPRPPGVPDDPAPGTGPDPVRTAPVEPGLDIPLRARVTGLVVGPDGEPARGVVVYATSPEAAITNALVPDRSLAEGTDEAGRFTLSVEPGTIDFIAYRRGWLPFVRKDLRVEAGQLLDLGRIRLMAGLSVSGVVVDTEGAYVPGVTVVAFRDEATMEETRLPNRYDAANWWSSGQTDDAGRFSVGGLSPKPVFLRAQRYDIAMEGPPKEVEPGATGIRLVVRRLRLATGRVVEQDSQVGVPGATVSIVLWTRAFTETQHYRTLGDGRFVFDLSADRYRDPQLKALELRATTPGYEDFLRPEPSLGDLIPAAKYVIPLVRAVPVDPGKLNGRVRYDTGEPFFGSLTLSFSAQGGAARIFRVETTAEGEFDLDDVPPGNYALRTATRGRTLLADTGRRLVITSGGVESVEFTIVRGGDVQVKVTGEEGTGLPGARVEWRAAEGDETGEATGDGEGTVSLLDLPPGGVKLVISAPGHRPSERELEVVKAQGQSLSVRLRKE